MFVSESLVCRSQCCMHKILIGNIAKTTFHAQAYETYDPEWVLCPRPSNQLKLLWACILHSCALCHWSQARAGSRIDEFDCCLLCLNAKAWRLASKDRLPVAEPEQVNSSGSLSHVTWVIFGMFQRRKTIARCWDFEIRTTKIRYHFTHRIFNRYRNIACNSHAGTHTSACVCKYIRMSHSTLGIGSKSLGV